MTITVYTKPACPQCDFTTRALAKAELEYTTVDVTQDAEALARLREMGYASAPVVEAPTGTWSGFRPDRLKALSAA